MLTAVSGYYNGTDIVMDEEVPMSVGQRVIITFLTTKSAEHSNIELQLGKYMGRGQKMFTGDAGDFVKELRSNDRI